MAERVITSKENKRILIEKYVASTFYMFMEKLKNKYENKIDYEGRNITDYPSIAIDLTKITIDMLDKNGLL